MMNGPQGGKLKIAVVGAGISGLGAGWLLSNRHEVHVFESENRLGGHAHTVKVDEDNGKSVSMDTGFLVYNELTYPNLVQFFKKLNVETTESEMSLSVQVKSKNLEWSGTDLNSVFSQRRNLVNPRFYKLLLEILRFGREAQQNAAESAKNGWNLGQLLIHRKYSQVFYTDYLLPISAAIWSTPESRMLDFPAETFLTFFMNHKLLQMNDRPVWRTVKNGSIEYVKKAAASISKVFVSSPVDEVRRSENRVYLQSGGETLTYDAVILATHAPVTRKILTGQSDLENRILSSIQYEPNHAVLHRDSSHMPVKKRCWSSWNVMGAHDLEQERKVSLHYYLNRLQRLNTEKNYFVTLNAPGEINSVIRDFNYAHPQFDRRAIEAQKILPAIQGLGNIYYAGAWSRYGFHEDGLLSAVNVAGRLGVSNPWAS